MATTHSAELHNGIWTSWLPLTSAWPSQAACNTLAWARGGISAPYDSWPYIYDPAYGQSVAKSPTCLPPQATQWWDQGSSVGPLPTSYSIGPIVCPAAYTTYSTLLVSSTSTSVICCPTSFSFARNLLNNGGLDGLCTSPFSAGAVLTYASPAVESYIPATTTFTDNSALMFAVPVEGYNFGVAAATTGPSSNNNPLTTSNPLGGGSTPAATTQGNASGGGGLSAGAKAGIGVGVAGAVLISAAIVVGFLLLRRRKTVNELPGNGEHKDTTPAPVYAQTASPAPQPESSARPHQSELQA